MTFFKTWLPALIAAAAWTMVTSASAAELAIELVFADMSGTPISVATVGQAIQLEVFGQDVRDSPPAPGVFAIGADFAYADVALLGTAVFAPGWLADYPADYSQPGLIKQLGSFTLSFTPTGAVPLLIFSIPLVAGQAGLATFSTSANNPSEMYDLLLYGENNQIPLDQVNFGTTSLTIVPEPTTLILAAIGSFGLGSVVRAAQALALSVAHRKAA